MRNKTIKDINTKKIFYIGTIISVLIFTIGIIITMFHNPSENSVINFFESNYFAEITMFIPFSIWAWLVILAILFVKKNWVVVTLCILLAIPHIIFIIVLCAFSYSPLEILRWYVMILSFGIINI